MIDFYNFSTLCRHCLTPLGKPVSPHPCCYDPRIISHDELSALTIAHVDCDAFFAAIEKRDDPALADKPVIIGGGARGVVSTACYIARTYGVRSAMPMFKALKACPNAVVVRPNFEKYVKAGQQIRAMMAALSPLIEPLSIDEAFLDLSGTQKVHKAAPALILARLQSQIAREIGVTVSVGLSHNKFLAKIASDQDKPRGFFTIGKTETQHFLAAQPVGLIWGIGTHTAARLQRDGFATIGDLQRSDEKALAEKYGETGLRLARLARGVDTRPVNPIRDTKSVSAETTFDRDIGEPERLESILWSLCEKVSRRMKEKELTGRVVTLKLKSPDFRVRTRRQTLSRPTNLARILFDAGRHLLEPELGPGKFRLIGIGYSELYCVDEPLPQQSFFEDDYKKLTAREAAIDQLRARFGNGVIGSGRSFSDHGKP